MLSVGIAFAELTEIYQIEADFEAEVRQAFDRLVEEAAGGALVVEVRGATCMDRIPRLCICGATCID
jgi:hypothetical protein